MLRPVSVLLIALPLLACGKKDKPVNDFLAQEPKLVYDIKVVAVDEPDAQGAPFGDTWATHVKDLVRVVNEDLAKCRNEYLIPFNFDKMRRRNMEWVNITEMDAVCIDGDPSVKKRGAWLMVKTLADETGKHTQLDRFVVLALDQLEHFKVVSFMTKKVGSPEIAKVTDTAKAARDRILTVGSQIDALAAEIAKWPDGQAPDDDPQAIGKPVELAAFRQQLVQNQGWFLADVVNAYDRYAAKSWESPNIPKLTTLHAWIEIPGKRLQADRARLAHVTGADEKQLAEIRAYMDAVDKALQAVRAGLPRYEKKQDEMDEKDPNRKAIEQAQAAVLKLQKPWTPAAAKP